MKRLLALLLVLVCGPALAQTCTPASPPWTLSSIGVSASNVSVGTQVNISAGFISCAAGSGATLDIEIYDSSGTKVSQSWQTGVDFTAGQTIIASQLAYTAGPAGLYTVKAGVFTSAGLAYWNASAASFAVSAVVINPCLPKVQWPLAVAYGPVLATVSTRYDTYAVWVCNLPGGYQTTSALFTLSDVAPYTMQYAAGLWTKAQAAADCTRTCVPATAQELAFIAPIIQANRPKATVGYSALSATRAVYTLTAAGTVSAAVPGESVATARACIEWDRIPGTAFYSVAGQPNAAKAGTTLPKGSYSSCTITFPLAPN